MKKTRLIFTALAVAFSLSSFQMEAAKSAVRKRFDASLDRFKKCFKGKCTRAEGLKAARDLGIAAVAVVVGGAIAGKGAAMLMRRWVPSSEAMGIYSTSDSAATGNQPASASATTGARRRRPQDLSQGQYDVTMPAAGVGEYSDDDESDLSSDPALHQASIDPTANIDVQSAAEAAEALYGDSDPVIW